MTVWSTFGRRWSALPGVSAALTFLSVREKLTANRTYYVRTDGSDSNTGLADSAGGAFLTIGKAMAVVAAIDLGGFIATVQVGDGTFAENVVPPRLVGGNAVLQGNTGTPANCIISPASGRAISIDGIGGGWSIAGFKLVTTSLWALYVAGNSSVSHGAMEYGAATLAHIYAAANSVVTVTASYSISGASGVHWQCFDGGRIICQSKTITVTGTPAFSTAFALCGRTSAMAVNANTFSGSATGVRYNVNTNSVIDTAGGGATYLPGGTAGTTATGGQYV